MDLEEIKKDEYDRGWPKRLMPQDLEQAHSEDETALFAFRVINDEDEGPFAFGCFLEIEKIEHQEERLRLSVREPVGEEEDQIWMSVDGNVIGYLDNPTEGYIVRYGDLIEDLPSTLDLVAA